MMDTSGPWDNQDPTLSVPSQDDFNQFLDLGMNNLGDSLQFDFPEFGAQQSEQAAQLMHRHNPEAMDLGNGGGGGGAGGVVHDTTMQEPMPSMTTATSHPSILTSPITHNQAPDGGLVELDAQIRYLQHQRQQRQQQAQQQQQQAQQQMQEQQRNFYTQNPMVPPTPTSMELHPNSSHFYPQSDPQQQAMYDRYHRQMKDQDMAFTPLVSPAVTPLETHFNIPEYTVPGAYFSPLSSPALRAQNEQQATAYDHRLTATTNSPIDMNMDAHSALNSSGTLSRKASKKTLSKPRATRAVRQSPIVKAKRSKRGSITAQALGDILEPSHHRSKETNSSLSAPSTDHSENSSISPEHLSDMAPPPVPSQRSSSRSPYIASLKDNPQNQHLALGSPATPASLMRLANSPQINESGSAQHMDIDDSGIDGFALPEAATSSRPQLARFDTQSDGQTTPTLSSVGAKTPGFAPLPSPAFARPASSKSATSSPRIDAMTGNSNNAGKKASQGSSRAIKKRSGSSILASPALLPRISPNIKPLAPGSTKISDNTASLLLTSKSNYQNILEGNHLPGVSYPSELSTNLTSKRTSHKIAEQGRRNRINSALQEIATLLPGAGKDSCGEKSGSGDAEEGNDNGGNTKGGGQSANSKASTVEQAIDYIKQLKKDLADAHKRAEEAEKKLTEAT